MSTPLPCVETMPEKQRKTRRTHAKVKTGCNTCKIRKKKCDEAKPSCLRCTSTGRECDGYASPSPITADAPSKTSLLEAIATRSLGSKTYERNRCHTVYHERAIYDLHLELAHICRAPSIVVLSHEIDKYCFDYFRYNTGLQLQSYFDSFIWLRPVMRAAHLHPTVLKAATAVGAVHQRFNHGISREAFEYCAVADRLYREAVRSFQDFRHSKAYDSNFNEISTITCMLLSVFETFQGNLDKAVHHAEAGLRAFWTRSFTVTHSETSYHDYVVKPSVLFDIVERMTTYSTQLFGSPPTNLALYSAGKALPPVPLAFQSLEDARDFIFAEMNCLLYTPARLWHDEYERAQARNRHVSRILQWSVASAELARVQHDRQPMQQRASYLLKAVRDVAYVTLYAIFFITPDHTASDTTVSSNVSRSQFDINIDTSSPALYLQIPRLWTLISTHPKLPTNLTRLRLLTDTLLDANSPFSYISHSLSMDSGIGPPLSPVACASASSKTRHVMINLLRQNTSPATDLTSISNPDSEAIDLWNLLGIYTVGERLGSIEEHAVIATYRDLVPKDLRVRWVEVTLFVEERRALLKYCWPSPCERGLAWVQEWLEF